MQYGIGSHYFFDSLRGFITIGDFLTGVIKSAVFGLLVTLFACREGLVAQQGTQGVGVATTRAVVDATLAVIVANYFLSVVSLRILERGP